MACRKTMLLVTCLFVVTGLSSSGNAEPPLPQQPATQPAPSRYAQPYTPTPSYPQPYGSTQPYVTRVKPTKSHHLQQAAEHLKAAGKNELAKELAQEAKELEKQERLQAKLLELRKLQAEIEELRRVAYSAGRPTKTTNPQQVILQIEMLELNVSKMRELGLDFALAKENKTEKHASNSNSVILTKQVRALLDALRKNGLVKVISSPTLITTSGRPASMHCGGALPVAVPGKETTKIEYLEIGTRLECVAVVLDGRRLRLELRPTISNIDASEGTEIYGIQVPGIKTSTIHTAVEMELGQSVLLRGLSYKSKQKNADEKELLLVVKADAVDSKATAAKSEQPYR